MPTTLDVTVNDTKLVFNVSLADFNAYTNEMQPGNKVGPSNNFLMRTVDKDSREQLKDLLLMPGMVLELATAIVQEYKPAVQISVGKRNASTEA